MIATHAHIPYTTYRHPDKNPSEKAKAEMLFMAIKDAYECLSDPIKRRRYDKV